MMKIQPRTTNVRPGNAILVYSFNLFKNRRAFWALNGGGITLLILFGMLFSWYVSQIRPGLIFELVITSANIIYVCLSLLGITMGVVVLHEGVHGIFSWIVTHSRPIFGFRGGYFYTANPGWYFSRRQFVIIALAPFMLLSILGLILLVIAPSRAIPAVLIGTILNAAGAVGDFFIIFLAARERRPIVIEDLGDGMNFYALS